jgi:diaminopimelate decarboxylase
MLHDGDFSYVGGALACEGVDLESLAAIHGTPAYIYSRHALVARFHAYKDALNGVPHQVCFAVKANSNLAILSALVREGAGFDIVSGGELYRVLAAGGDPSRVVFSGVGKTEAEIRFALERGIHSFNCESKCELHLISRVASALGKTASVALRVNPDVDAITHPYISTGLREHKFGIDIAAAEDIYLTTSRLPGIAAEGVSCHIGSQLLDIKPLLEAAGKTLDLVDRLRSHGLPIRFLDLGGGLGVPYRSSDRPVSAASLVEALKSRLAGRGLTLMLEPGRSIVAEAGILLTRVLLTKKNAKKTFIVVDAGMNDLIRPSLYQAHHEIVPVKQIQGRPDITADIVGPVCETGDFFARGRQLPAAEPGDLLAIRTAGAYGFVLSSNYNSRPRPCELLIDRDSVHVARRRETWEDLVRGELPDAILHTS